MTSNPGGLTVTGAASPMTVSGLTNGTAYTFTVKASMQPGTGTGLGVVQCGVPTGLLPGRADHRQPPPTPATRQATVTFIVPASDGGSPITRTR